MDENGKDQGVNIRHKVKELIDFIQDDDRLREERKKAKKNKDKYTGISSDTFGMRFGKYAMNKGGRTYTIIMIDPNISLFELFFIMSFLLNGVVLTIHLY